MEDQFFAKLTYNGNDCTHIEEMINAIIGPNCQIEQSKEVSQYKNVSIIEEQKENQVNFQSKEEAGLRYDFEILHNKYLVFKCGVSLYYFNLLSYDEKSEMQKLKLNLRPGVITQIV